MDSKLDLEKALLEKSEGIENNIKKMAKLQHDDKVRQYLQLLSENKNLVIERREIKKRLNTLKYNNCNHLGIKTFIERDFLEGRVYHYYGCVKCGLDERCIRYYDRNNEDEVIMHDYLLRFSRDFTFKSDNFYDLSLAQAVYAKIKAVNPNIDDQIALKYLEIALYNMYTKDTTEQRRKGRIKRLSLPDTTDLGIRRNR